MLDEDTQVMDEMFLVAYSANAVLAERERCAKIAESYRHMAGPLADALAAEIRKP